MPLARGRQCARLLLAQAREPATWDQERSHLQGSRHRCQGREGGKWRFLARSVIFGSLSIYDAMFQIARFLSEFLLHYKQWTSSLQASLPKTVRISFSAITRSSEIGEFLVMNWNTFSSTTFYDTLILERNAFAVPSCGPSAVSRAVALLLAEVPRIQIINYFAYKM